MLRLFRCCLVVTVLLSGLPALSGCISVKAPERINIGSGHRDRDHDRDRDYDHDSDRHHDDSTYDD